MKKKTIGTKELKPKSFSLNVSPVKKLKETDPLREIIPASCFYNDELKATILKKHKPNEKDVKFQEDLQKRLNDLENKFGTAEV
jgi:hypothetical protein